MTRTFTHGAALAMATAFGLTSAAAAEPIRVAIGQAEAHVHSQAVHAFADRVAAASDVEFEIYQLSLLSLPEIPAGLRDGIIGMGPVITAYKPAEYSETNFFADLSMLVTSGDDAPEVPSMAMSGAMMEYVLLNCPDCQAQYDDMNQVFLGTVSTAPYILMCNRKVEHLSDFKGLSFRSGAANFGRWAESVGGVKVSIPGNEIYEAMAQGVVDCSMLAASSMIENQLIEVTKHLLTGVPGGVFAGTALNAVNKNTWQGLGDEDRAVFLKSTAGAIAEAVFYLVETDKEAYVQAEKAGITRTEADAEIMAQYDAFVENDLDAIKASFSEQQGVGDIDAKIEVAQALIAKWKGLVKDVTSEADLEALYWNEVLSKVDPATYGMN